MEVDICQKKVNPVLAAATKEAMPARVYPAVELALC
jgi:hypothetical protein